jgi:hypothetical protein
VLYKILEAHGEGVLATIGTTNEIEDYGCFKEDLTHVIVNGRF